MAKDKKLKIEPAKILEVQIYDHVAIIPNILYISIAQKNVFFSLFLPVNRWCYIRYLYSKHETDQRADSMAL